LETKPLVESFNLPLANFPKQSSHLGQFMQTRFLGPLLMPFLPGARGNNITPLKYLHLHEKPIDPPDASLSAL
jgi:hypothetical protein